MKKEMPDYISKCYESIQPVYSKKKGCFSYNKTFNIDLHTTKMCKKDILFSSALMYSHYPPYFYD